MLIRCQDETPIGGMDFATKHTPLKLNINTAFNKCPFIFGQRKALCIAFMPILLQLLQGDFYE